MQNFLKRPVHIGLLCAMPEEIGSTIKNIRNLKKKEFGDLLIFAGEWSEKDNSPFPVLISVAWSGWGKVSSARAAIRLLSSSPHNIPIDLLLFTGVAGAAQSNIKQWDIIVPNELIQHDMNASPLYPKYVIPSLNKSLIRPLDTWVEWASSTLNEAIINKEISNFGKVTNGLIATGDSFISEKSSLLNLKRDLPSLSAVEMEGAAVAQVAIQENVNWLIIRVISDNADSSAAQNFSEFLKDYENYSWNLIEALLKNFTNAPLEVK